MAKTKRMAFGGMGAMPARPGPAVGPQTPPPAAQARTQQAMTQMPPPPQARNQMQSPMRPQQAGGLGTQTGGLTGMQRPQMPPPARQPNQGMAVAQQQMAQMQKAQQDMMRQQGALASGPIGQQRAQMPPPPQQGMGSGLGRYGTQNALANQGRTGGMLKKGGVVKNYADGGLTYAERKALMADKATPSKGDTKKNADIFRQGMKPPMDDDMGSAQPGQPGQPVKKKAKGGSIKASKMGAVKVSKPKMSSASSRADGIAIRGKTRA